MTYKEIREAFPFFLEWQKPDKDDLRLKAMNTITRDDLIVITKISELVGNDTEFDIEKLKWMYLFADEPNRKTIIAGYRELINEINVGKIKVC